MAKRQPTADADDDSIREADDRALSELREAEKPEKREREEEEEPDDGPVVLEEEEPAPEPQPNRRERRAARGRVIEENEQLRQQLALTSQQVQHLAALQARAQQPAEPQGDPEAARLEQESLAAWNEQQRVSADYAARHSAYAQRGQQMPMEEERGFHQQAHALELKRNRIAAQLAFRESGAGQQQAPQQPGVNPYVAHVNMQYQDVISDVRARSYAQALGNELLQRGEMNIQRYEETLKEARKVFLGGSNGKGNGRPAPTAESRAKYAGQGAGSGGGGEARPVIRISTAEKRMANAAYPHIKDDKKRYSKWVTDQGPEWMNERSGRSARSE